VRGALGRAIVVGGHSRGIGKTALVEQVLEALGSPRVAAVKISAHRHAATPTSAPVIERALHPSATSQTGRYLAAGADRAWLCRCPTERMGEAAAFVHALRADGWDVVIESNRIVRDLVPDLLFFVVSGQVHDWKPSSGPCLCRADAIVLSSGTTDVPMTARRLGGASAGRSTVLAFTEHWTVPGLGPWMHGRLPRPSAGPRKVVRGRDQRVPGMPDSSAVTTSAAV